MKNKLQILAGAITLWVLAGTHLTALSSINQLPFEKTDPTYQLPGNPHPSLPELIEGLEQQTVKTPEDAEIWYQLGLSYFKAKRFPDAVDALQRAVKLDSVHVRAWEMLGFSLYLSKRSQESLAAFKRATELGAATPSVWGGYALILLDNNRLEESDAAFAMAFKLKGESRALWFGFGLLRERQGRYPESISAFQKMLEIDPTNAQGWTNLAVAQANLKDYDDELASALKATTLDPKMEGAWVALAIAYTNKKQWNEEQAAAREAIATAPTSSSGWVTLAYGYLNLHRWEEAVENYHQGIDVLSARQSFVANDQEYAEILSNYAVATTVIGHLDDAEKILKGATDLDSNDARVLAAVGELRLRQKRLTESVDASQKSLDLDPGISRTWDNLGAALLGLNKAAEALPDFQKATGLQPEFALAWYHTGEANQMLGQMEYSAIAYRKAVEFLPGFIDAMNGLATVTNDPVESDKAIAQALALDPNNATIYIISSNIQLRRKNWPEAEQAALKATQIAPVNPEAWMHLSVAYADQKKYSEAVTACEEAIKNASNLPPAQVAKYWAMLAEDHLNLAIANKEQSEWQAALDALSHQTTLDPNNAHAWYLTACCLNSLGRQDEMKAAEIKCAQLGGEPGKIPSATSLASQPATDSGNAISPSTNGVPTTTGTTKALTDDQKQQIANFNQIKALLAAHKNDEALAVAQSENNLHPERAVTWFSLGEVLQAMARYDDSIAASTKAITLDPKLGFAWLDLGECLYAKGRYDDAIDALTKSIESISKVPMSWETLNACYVAKHDLAADEVKFQELVQAHPDSAFGWYVLAGIESDKGASQDSINHYQKALSLNSNYGPIWNGLGIVYARLNQIDKAEDAFMQAIHVRPGYDEALNNLGYAYFLTGQTDKAIDCYKQALQSNPKHSRALFNLVSAYSKENQWDLAKQTCATLAQYDPSAAARLSQNFPSAPSAPAQPSQLQIVMPGQ